MDDGHRIEQALAAALADHPEGELVRAARYATLGFNDSANLDDGALWPTSFALKALTAVEEAKISALLKKAVS